MAGNAGPKSHKDLVWKKRAYLCFRFFLKIDSCATHNPRRYSVYAPRVIVSARVLENVKHLGFGFLPSPRLAEDIRGRYSYLHLLPEKAAQRAVGGVGRINSTAWARRSI